MPVLPAAAQLWRPAREGSAQQSIIWEVRFSSPLWQIDGQAVALQLGKARTAGSTGKGQFALKRFNPIKGLVLGLFKAQPFKQTCSPHAQASAQLWGPAPEGSARQSAIRVVHFSSPHW
jgi:hypothetical protein